MTGINHKQAQRYLRAAADGLLRENQRALLDAHLRDCVSCRAEADELNALEARLKKNFQARWDANDGPSTNVMTTIQLRSRRIIMTNRINTALKTVAGIAALLVLIVSLNSVFKQLQENSQQGTIVPGSTSSIPYPITSTQSSSEELSTPDEFSMTVQEAEALAGFDVLEPSHLPEGYVLQDALYNSQAKLVELRYISLPITQDSGGSGLIIVNQKRGSFDLGPAFHPYETPVPIGDVEGVFIRGAYVSEATDGRAYTWDALGEVYTLSWQKDKMAYTISFLGGETIPPIPLAELVAIAESMK